MQSLLSEYRERGNKILLLKEFMVMMDEVRKAGWKRFRPVEGQPIAEKDMRKIFRLVDLDKDGTISHMVSHSHSVVCMEYGGSFLGAETVIEIPGQEIRIV